jgi:molybdopterin-guanine dinucleotide biosynthesis protein A
MTRALTVAIQAGGKSTRMGTDKAFALLDGKPLIEHVLDKVRQMDPAEILIITKTPERYPVYEGVKVVTDTADMGALGGLQVALSAAQHENLLMLACDMPFLNPALLAFIADLQTQPPSLAIVPRWEGQAEALHALYNRRILYTVRRRLDEGQLSLHRMLEGITERWGERPSFGKHLIDLGVRWLDALEYVHLDANGHSFTNINTPDDLRAAQSKLET